MAHGLVRELIWAIMCCICVHWNGTLGVLAEGSILYMYGPSWAVSDLNPPECLVFV